MGRTSSVKGLGRRDPVVALAAVGAGAEGVGAGFAGCAGGCCGSAMAKEPITLKARTVDLARGTRLLLDRVGLVSARNYGRGGPGVPRLSARGREMAAQRVQSKPIAFTKARARTMLPMWSGWTRSQLRLAG